MFINFKRITALFIFTTSYFISAKAQWSNLTKLVPNLDVSDVWVNGPRIIAVGTSFTNGFVGHILKSEDNGLTWDTTQISPPGYFLKTIAFKDADTGFIGGYGSVSIFLRTTDGGKTWAFFQKDFNNSGITDMQFLDKRVGFACGYGSKQFFTGNVYRTTDGGANWVAQADPLDSLPMDGMQMLNQKEGYAWGGTFGFKSILRTTDSGKSWKPFYTHSTIPGGLYWWTLDEGIIVDAAAGIYKTYDGGKNWKKITAPVTGSMQLNSVAFTDNHTGYIAGTAGVILQSADKGETWKRVSSPTGRTLTHVRFHGDRAYMTGYDGVLLRSLAISDLNAPGAEKALQVYPNPAGNELFIHIAEGKRDVLIYDMKGQLVMKTALGVKVDISGLDKGIFIACIGGYAPVKFIKQ